MAFGVHFKATRRAFRLYLCASKASRGLVGGALGGAFHRGGQRRFGDLVEASISTAAAGL